MLRPVGLSETLGVKRGRGGVGRDRVRVGEARPGKGWRRNRDWVRGNADGRGGEETEMDGVGQERG